MFTIKAKYNSANIMLPDESYIDDETKKQIYSFLNHPAFAKSYISIMPDCHAGKGSCVGFTMTANDYALPFCVGVDIGCGMIAIKLEGIKNIDLNALDHVIHRIPSGFNRYPNDQRGSDKPYNRNLDAILATFGKDIGNKRQMDILDIQAVADEVGTKFEDVVCSLGTLGGGNHFIELDIDDSGIYWLVIHSGSRNFGLKVASYHQAKAKSLMNEMFVGDAFKGLEFLPMNKGGLDYIHDMRIAQKYAVLNRYMIANSIVQYFIKASMCDFVNISSIHNYISEKDNIIRKGAISANEGEQLIIPLNMRDGTIIGVGKGSKKWNNSAPHGAGRIMSRSKAKESLSMPDYKASMDGIFTTCVTSKTIDEAPMAYKDKQLILDAIGETVDVKAILKPVYNFKAGGD
jgi:tRNA-splicing ligase RtcB (3'-phosphate/5'-hydroxy nucleic acid ligase)